MLQYKTGDILAEETEALVNTVNCVGVMGRGIALQFKNAFPDNFKAYAEACKRQEVQPGHMFVFDTGRLTNPRYIINFPTKRHWRGKSRMADIEAGLKALQDVMREKNIRSLAMPPLGTGLGGLDWNEVRLRIEEAAGRLQRSACRDLPARRRAAGRSDGQTAISAGHDTGARRTRRLDGSLSERPLGPVRDAARSP